MLHPILRSPLRLAGLLVAPLLGACASSSLNAFQDLPDVPVTTEVEEEVEASGQVRPETVEPLLDPLPQEPLAVEVGPRDTAKGAIELIVASRTLSDSVWEELDGFENQSVFGVQACFLVGPRAELVIGHQVGRSESDAPGTRIEGTLTETSFGIRSLGFDGTAEKAGGAFLGAGLSLVEGELEVGGATGTDDATGFYVEAGAMTQQRAFRAGIALRYLTAGFEEIEADADYFQIGFVLGIRL